MTVQEIGIFIERVKNYRKNIVHSKCRKDV